MPWINIIQNEPLNQDNKVWLQLKCAEVYFLQGHDAKSYCDAGNNLCLVSYKVAVTIQLYALQLTWNVFYVTKYFIKRHIYLWVKGIHII